MESRGYGRSVHRDARSRRRATALTLGGLCGVVAGVYGLLDGGSAPLLGLPLLVAGATAATASLAVGARRDPRSRYRPDPWAAPEWLVLASGVAAGGLVLAGRAARSARHRPADLAGGAGRRCPCCPPWASCLGCSRPGSPRCLRSGPSSAPPAQGTARLRASGQRHDPVRGRRRQVRRPQRRPSSAASTCSVPEGELVLVVGRTGTGKSTLLRCVNGLVPHFTGGTLSRPGQRRRARHPHPPPARPGRRRRHRRAGPGWPGFVTDIGRGRARLRHGVARHRPPT